MTGRNLSTFWKSPLSPSSGYKNAVSLDVKPLIY